jgi:hypothetical protein
VTIENPAYSVKGEVLSKKLAVFGGYPNAEAIERFATGGFSTLEFSATADRAATEALIEELARYPGGSGLVVSGTLVRFSNADVPGEVFVLVSRHPCEQPERMFLEHVFEGASAAALLTNFFEGQLCSMQVDTSQSRQFLALLDGYLNNLRDGGTPVGECAAADFADCWSGCLARKGTCEHCGTLVGVKCYLLGDQDGGETRLGACLWYEQP